MRIVHFADLHLDSAFAWCGAAGDAARNRRQALRNTLLAIAKLTRTVDAKALFCAGDLYEHDRVTPDTVAFLRKTFAELDPIRVYIAPGNHDFYGPQSLYATGDWSDNVHIFTEPCLRPVPLADGITLWGAAHCTPAKTPSFLDGFPPIEKNGVHVALFHGAESSWLAEQGQDKQPHAPFNAIDIENAGLHHAFLGHYHRPKDAKRHTYPGNPDPLQFGEDGTRGAVVASISPNGTVEGERHSVAVTQVHDLTLDVTGCTFQDEVIDLLVERVNGRSGVARLTVKGDLEPDIDLQESDLHGVLDESFDAFQIRTGDLHPGFDIDAIQKEATVRGQFVKDVLKADLPPDEERRILITGLRALDGRDDLEVL